MLVEDSFATRQQAPHSSQTACLAMTGVAVAALSTAGRKAAPMIGGVSWRGIWAMYIYVINICGLTSIRAIPVAMKDNSICVWVQILRLASHHTLVTLQETLCSTLCQCATGSWKCQAAGAPGVKLRDQNYQHELKSFSFIRENWLWPRLISQDDILRRT